MGCFFRGMVIPLFAQRDDLVYAIPAEAAHSLVVFQIPAIKSNRVVFFTVVKDVPAYGNVIGEFLAAPVVAALVLGWGVGQQKLFFVVLLVGVHRVRHAAIIEIERCVAILKTKKE